MPGEDEDRLLESLKGLGALRDEKNIRIEKSSEDSTISVVTPQNIISVRLNVLAQKATVYIDNLKTHDYKITTYGSEITAVTARQLVEDPIKTASDRSRKIIEPYIFELVSDLTEDEIRVLARDTKFMVLLEDMNTKFDSGYQRLMKLRKSL